MAVNEGLRAALAMAGLAGVTVIAGETSLFLVRRERRRKIEIDFEKKSKPGKPIYTAELPSSWGSLNTVKPGAYAALLVTGLETVPGAKMQDAVNALYDVANNVYVDYPPAGSIFSRFGAKVLIHRAPPELKYGVDFTDLATGQRKVVKLEL